MALSATFTANFASFYDAVDKADAKLKTFGDGADKVGGRLNTLANQFSGQKIVQEATIMAKAVEEIGGASKLTEKELARLGATTNEAVAKMKALGMEVPQNLQKIADQTKGIADQTKGATKATTDWMGSLTKIAGAFGVGFGISQLVGFGKAALESAGKINDLASKLGVSTDAIQRWSFAVEQGGGSIETVNAALSGFNKTMGEGSSSTRALLKDIGLNFQTLRSMRPEDAFEAVVGAVEKIDDPIYQANAAVQLFGKSGQELLPAIRDGFLEVARAADVVEKDTVAALARMGDELDKLWTRMKNRSMEILGALAKGANIAIDWETIAQDIAKTTGMTYRDAYAYTVHLTEAEQQAYLQHLKDKDYYEKLATQVQTATNAVTPHIVKTKEQIEAETKAAAAAAAHANKIKELAAAMSGVALTQKVKDLTEAVNFNVKAYGAAALESKALIDEVNALAKEGAALSPELQRVRDKTLAVEAAMMRVKLSMGGVIDMGPNVAAAVTAMGDAFLASTVHIAKTQLETDRLLAKFPDVQAQLETFNANVFKGIDEQASQRVAAGVRLIETAFGTLGQHGGAAFQTIMQMADIAVVGMVRYKTAITDAEKETIALQTTTAIATLGMTAAINLFYGVWQHHQDQIHNGQQQIHDLQQEILALGATPTGGPLVGTPGPPSVLPMDAGKIAALQQQLKDLQAAQQHAIDEQNKLNEAVQKYGLTWRDLVGEKQVEALDKQLENMTETLGRLRAAGYTDTAIVRGMKDEFNNLLRVALETGQKLPASYLPFLTQLARSGDLADDVKRKLLGIADPAPWQDMKTAAEKYGIALGDLGPAFQQSRLDDMSKDLLHDWKLLVDNGANVDAVIAGMSGKVNDLVHDSLKFGTTIPENMKPMLEAMARAGTLTDENGEKLTDLTKLTFSHDLTEDFDKLILKLDELIDKLGGDHPNSVAGAAEATAAHIETSFNDVRINPIHVPYVFDAENPPDFDVDAGGRARAPHLARGGIVTRPTFALIGEAGPEAVVPLGAGGALPTSAPINITVVSQLDGREVARNQVRYIPRALVDAGF